MEISRVADTLIENLRQEMGWGEEKAKRGQGKWSSSQATDQALDLLPPLFQSEPVDCMRAVSLFLQS